VDRIMLEVDYPHGDGTWPDTQETIARTWGHVLRQSFRTRPTRHPLPEKALPADE